MGLACETVMKDVEGVSVARNFFPDAVQCNSSAFICQSMGLEFFLKVIVMIKEMLIITIGIITKLTFRHFSLGVLLQKSNINVQIYGQFLKLNTRIRPNLLHCSFIAGMLSPSVFKYLTRPCVPCDASCQSTYWRLGFPPKHLLLPNRRSKHGRQKTRQVQCCVIRNKQVPEKIRTLQLLRH